MTSEGKNRQNFLVKKTLYITQEQSKTLALIKAIENKNEYDVTIEALDKHLADEYGKYMEMAKDKSKK